MERRCDQVKKVKEVLLRKQPTEKVAKGPQRIFD
jgi:hypothetical protein